MAAAASAAYPRRSAAMRGSEVDVRQSYKGVIRFLPEKRFQCLICEARLSVFGDQPAPILSLSSSSNASIHVANCCPGHLVKEHLSHEYMMKAFRANLAKNNLHLVGPAPEDQTTLQFLPTSVLYSTFMYR